MLPELSSLWNFFPSTLHTLSALEKLSQVHISIKTSLIRLYFRLRGSHPAAWVPASCPRTQTPSSPGPGKPEYLPREGAESVRRGRAPAPPWPPTSGPSPPRRPAHLARASRAGDGLIDLGKRQPSPPRPQPLAAAPAPRLQFLLPPARFLAQPGPGGGVLRGAPSDPRQQRSAAGDEI